MDLRVSGGRDFMLGAQPGLPDALCYYLVWLLRGRYSSGPAFLEQFPNLGAWEKRVAAIGHGTPEDLSAQDALAIAKAHEPTVAEAADPGDPMGLAPGDAVEVIAGAGGAAVAGTVIGLSRDHIAIRHADPRVGNVSVTFPRFAYDLRRHRTVKTSLTALR